ncbi:MAG TPA: phage minor head protein [Candidatus Paceibacterota bacterium]|nr:phage minor head protein [Candidatus Paceibacterota bacterium]
MDPKKLERAFARAGRTKGVHVPESFQLATEKLLVVRQVNLWELGLEAALPLVPEPTKDALILDTSLRDISSAVNSVYRRYSGLTSLNQKLKEQYLRGEGLHRSQFLATINNAIGVSVKDLLHDQKATKLVAERLVEAVDLIKTLDYDLKTKLSREIWEAIQKGSDKIDVKKSILERSSVSEYRARLIALDQTSKLFSNLSRVRQEDIGVEKYNWRTVGDGAVRDEHQALEADSPHRWDTPTEEGYPGDAVQCRCVAEPILSSVTF